MIPETAARTQPHVTEEVGAFAEKHGLAEYLPGLIDLAQRVYTSATRFAVFLEEDHEIENDWYVVLEIDIPSTHSTEEWWALQQLWDKEVFAVCPTRLWHLFRCIVSRRP